jgi:hypothetical protein
MASALVTMPFMGEERTDCSMTRPELNEFTVCQIVLVIFGHPLHGRVEASEEYGFDYFEFGHIFL